MVSGSNGNKYAVSLFPQEKCQFPAVSNCYHILAARISIGQNLHEKKAKVSMTQFAKNKRKRCDKISAKNKPHYLDYEITPAPDSKLVELESKNEDIDKDIKNEISGLNTPIKSILKTLTTKHKKKDVTFLLEQPPTSKSTSTPKQSKSRIQKARRSLSFQENLSEILGTIPNTSLSNLICTPKLDLMEEHNRTDTMEVSDDNGSNNENTKDIAWWVKELDLRITDKETLLEKGAWLNDASMHQ